MKEFVQWWNECGLIIVSLISLIIGFTAFVNNKWRLLGAWVLGVTILGYACLEYGSSPKAMCSSSSEVGPITFLGRDLAAVMAVPVHDKAPAWCKNAGELVPVVRGLSGVSAGRFLVDKDNIAQCRYMTNEELKLEEK